MKKIKDFSPPEEATLVVKLHDVQIRKTSANADYASMLAFDGVDTIEAKIWNYTDEIKDKLVSGEVYVANGRMKDYQGKMQFNIVDIRPITEEDNIDITEFYEYAKIDLNKLQDLITSYINKIDNPILKEITVKLLKKYYQDFFLHPAAVNMHHNYFSGLAYHTYTMLKLSDTFMDIYPSYNRSLVYAGIILHDIGKVIELSGPKGTEYTKKGTLIGHITIGANEIYEIAKELNYENTDEVISLIHIVISHHGQLEYGSPKEPLIPEALLIHLLDYCDSKLAALEKEVVKTEKGEYTNPILTLNRKSFYLPDLKK
ncbi:MAG TPA: HD domain-containing protein [Acholeplasmataceae bacterium]|jgi:3'-5' exoribonuclease|nr:HD domain-containing protein [Acholeplasmataceae bacterium]